LRRGCGEWGDARARFERADSVLFGMPESNAELATAFLPM
jgi:hypothetical protein